MGRKMGAALDQRCMDSHRGFFWWIMFYFLLSHLRLSLDTLFLQTMEGDRRRVDRFGWFCLSYVNDTSHGR